MFSSRKSSAPAAGGYSLTKSLRFRSSASAYLSRTPSSSSNTTTWTWSGWVKRGTFNSQQTLFGTVSVSGSNQTAIQFNSSNQLDFYIYTGNYTMQMTTSQIFVDASSWYHIVCALDTTQSTASNRVKVYVNGVQVTSFSTTNLPYINLAGWVNTVVGHGIGENYPYNGSSYFDGELAEINFVDGQQLTPSSFGAFSATTGVWQPIKYTGTYGTNGFHLPFTNTTSTTTLGYDTSGNGNNWTTNNISLTAGSTYDSMNDVPNVASATASNYSVMNPNQAGANVTLSNGNLNVVGGTSSKVLGTIGMTSGKWYCEMVMNSGSTNGNFGLARFNTTFASNSYLGDDTTSWCYATNGNTYTNGTGTSYGSTYTVGDIIGIAFDADAGTLKFYKNGTVQNSGTPAVTGLTSGPYMFAQGAGSSNVSINFGQQPFTYTPPSGFVALNTYNLPTPTIVNGASYMTATTWTSAGGTETIVNTVNGVSCQPDFVWLKNRSISQNHYLFDSNRGASKYLVSNQTAAEGSDATFLTSFNSNGFSLGTDGFTAGQSIVGWQWQAGKGTNVSNTNGSITSTVSANQTAGFSIVTYTGNNTNGATVGHGLGVAPNVIIFKDRTNTSNWVWNDSILGDALFLNTTAASSVANLSHGYSGYANFTSTTFTLSSYGGGDMAYVNASGDSYVAYCFASIAGFSSFGSYTGNNSTTGPFVYLGFRPKYVMIKYAGSSGGTDWEIYDSARDTYNSVIHNLMADTANAEATSYSLSFLSNGFQITSLTSNLNDSGVTYIYLAFAANPFKYSLGY